MTSKKNRFDVSLELSGERFNVIYGLWGDEAAARGKAEDICVEQTIEFPQDLVTSGDIRKYILGRLESFEPWAAGAWRARISFPVEIAGAELTQLMNVIFGNFSLKPNVRVEALDLPEGPQRQRHEPLSFYLKTYNKRLA